MSEREQEMEAMSSEVEGFKDTCKVIRESGVIPEFAALLGDCRRELLNVGFREMEIMKILEIAEREFRDS
jgi:hypothetical protein